MTEKTGKKSSLWLHLSLAALMPLAPLFYLYVRNAEYLDFSQVLYLAVGMALLSLLGFLVLKAIFKSNASGVAGCAAAWICLFGYNSFYSLIVKQARLLGFIPFVIAYAAAALLLILLLAFLFRKLSSNGAAAFLSIMLGAVFVMNLVPALSAAISDRNLESAIDRGLFKTEFSVDPATKTPSVYWIHADGMLGFSAFEKYFGDDQAAFKEELNKRGFLIDENATFEAAHTTVIAVPSLMCPDYYDRRLADKLADNDSARALRGDKSFLRTELQDARIHNELVAAFKARGYTTQLMARHSTCFTPLFDKLYNTYAQSGVMLTNYSGDEEQVARQYLASIKMKELLELFFKRGSQYFAKELLPQTKLDREFDGAKAILLNEKGKSETVNLLTALNDALDTEGPSFNLLNCILAHYPFEWDENGNPSSADENDIMSYAPQHRYAAKALIGIVDMILSRDPDAVIVIQGDHGLHGQKEEQIAAAFGEDAILPVWNQVISCLRVPEGFQTGEEERAAADPLNISRYLVNSFVGKNYSYR